MDVIADTGQVLASASFSVGTVTRGFIIHKVFIKNRNPVSLQSLKYDKITAKQLFSYDPYGLPTAMANFAIYALRAWQNNKSSKRWEGNKQHAANTKYQ